MPIVFISYQRDSQNDADEVRQKLSDAGLIVWQDVENIRHTDRWQIAIDRALREADRLVLLLTPKAMKSEEVFNEWVFFYSERKPIHCLMIETCKPFYSLVPFQYLDWRQADKRDWKRLINELNAPFVWPSLASQEKVIHSPFAPTRTLPEAFTALLDAVRKDTGIVALNDQQIEQIIKHHPADLTEYRAGRIAEWSQPRYQLDNRFVNLILLIDQGEKAERTRWITVPESRQFNDLRDVLKERPDDPVLVLLGAPGSGKSTLLRRLQLDNAIDVLRGNSETVMFFAPLNAFRTDSGSPRDWLNAEWTRRYPDLPKLDALLGEGRVVLLLDALNEMQHKSPADYHERVGLWRIFIQDMVSQGNRAIFTCRSLDYSASLSSKDLRVPQVVVQRMNDTQMQRFLAAYLPARADRAWQELKGTVQLDLFRTPYFLKLLCDQVEANQSVPKGRASLFTGFVRQALERELTGGNALFLPGDLLTDQDHQKLTLNRWRSSYELPERGILFRSLGQLAYAMQEKGLETEGAQVRIHYDDACRVLNGVQNEHILKAGLALNVLDEDLTKLEILFFHQLLQEFFAARQLAGNPKPELVRVAWQISQVRPSLAEILANIADTDRLPLLPQTGWEETTLLAAVMNEQPEAYIRALMDVNLPLAARAAATAEVTTSDGLKHDLQNALIARTQDATADVRARIAAGLALGTLGDPRFERRTGPYGEYLLPPLSKPIPAGEYPIGADDTDYDGEKPIHAVRLNHFRIGIFPVTNAEYALFIAAGGYADERWWEADAAKAWRKGKGSTGEHKQALRDYRNYWKKHLEQSLIRPGMVVIADQARQLAEMSDSDFEALLGESFPLGRPYTLPDYWNDETYNNPAQPVVGICWYEALAYLAWLSAQTGQTYRLPTEVEFEAAARGKEGRKYPYGVEFDSTRCNTLESHIRCTTPIGIFDNATPEGVSDLSSNVYSWTSSAYKSYPYQAGDGRENAKRADVRRVLRGGSWFSSQFNARAVIRNINYSYDRLDTFGFRVCLGENTLAPPQETDSD